MNEGFSRPLPSAGEDEVVAVSYDDLVAAWTASSPSGTTSENASPSPRAHLLDDAVGRAFGSSAFSLGIIAVTNVPGLEKIRRTLLPAARAVANLSDDELDRVTVPSAYYTVGWSHGREKVEGDRFDTSKGSFYANPLADDPLEEILARRRRRRSAATDGRENGAAAAVEEEELEFDSSRGISEQELRNVASDNPAFFAPNVWPMKALPNLEGTFKEAGLLVRDVGKMVAQRCDAYVSARCPGYRPGNLESIVTHSKCCKGRLLHYFAEGNDDDDDGDDPPRLPSVAAADNDADFSTWCGWHNDHGSLTGLIPALYLDAEGSIVDCPDASAGLYVKSRAGRLVRAVLPTSSSGGGEGGKSAKSCSGSTLLFQVGETTQVHTGGLLQATPHAVKGCSDRRITRETFAVFLEPEYHSDMDIPTGRTVGDAQSREGERHLPRAVRTLRSRWKSGMNFGEFSEATFAAFH